MYANLRVTIPGEDEPVFAWRVVTGPVGVTIYLDANDEGSYAVEGGTRTVPHPVTVVASF